MKESSHEPKIVLIGIDSADYHVVQTLLKGEKLPNISTFRKEGIHRLPSTIPPHTAASWTSMFTGTNPGKHGVFYFRDVHSNRVLSSKDVNAPYLWDLLSQAGKRNIVINVPLTYPIRPIKGVMISGIHASKADSMSVYPEEIVPEIRLNYKFDLEGIDLPYSFAHEPDSAFDQLISGEASRVAIFTKFLREFEWDFACIVLTALDRIQHYFWGLCNSENPGGRYIERAYCCIDLLVGKILDAITDFEAVSFLVSDHGFEEKVKAININTILANAGLLRPRTVRNDFEERAVRFGYEFLSRRTPKRLGRILACALERLIPNLLTHRFDLPPIDSSRTRAYCYSYGLISINLRDRNQDGIVGLSEARAISEQVIRVIESTNIDGSEVRLSVLKSSEIYSGEKVSSAPDLVIVPLKGYYYSCHLGKNIFDNQVLGEHGNDGIIAINGKGVEINKLIDGAKVWDVAATVLKCFGFDVPEQMDGTPRAFLKNLSSFSNHTLLNSCRSSEESKWQAYTREEEEIIANRLKAMGYE